MSACERSRAKIIMQSFHAKELVRDWVTAMFRAICIMRKGRGGVRWGRSYDACNATTMALDELYHIIQWDLDHEVFALGNMVLRQLFGIGMGAPTSPSLAILVCAHCEHEFFASVYDACHFTPQLVAGTRYIDDVAQWFAV